MSDETNHVISAKLKLDYSELDKDAVDAQKKLNAEMRKAKDKPDDAKDAVSKDAPKKSPADAPQERNVRDIAEAFSRVLGRMMPSAGMATQVLRAATQAMDVQKSVAHRAAQSATHPGAGAAAMAEGIRKAVTPPPLPGAKIPIIPPASESARQRYTIIPGKSTADVIAEAKAAGTADYKAEAAKRAGRTAPSAAAPTTAAPNAGNAFRGAAAKHFQGLVNQWVGPVNAQAFAGFAGRFTGGGGGAPPVGGAAAGAAGGGGSMLAGAGPVAAIAAGFLMIKNNISTAFRSVHMQAQGIMRADPAQYLKGSLEPLKMMPLAGKFVEAGQMFIDQLEEMTNALSKYNPILYANQRQYEAMQRMYNAKLASTFQETISGWQRLKGSLLELQGSFLGLFKPLDDAFGWVENRLADGVGVITSAFKNSAYYIAQAGAGLLKWSAQFDVTGTMGAVANKAQKYADGLNPTSLADQAKALAAAVLGALDQGLGGPVAGGRPNNSLDTSKLPHRAAGGPVDRGRAYLVGEKGPEVFVPNGSGKIVPNGTPQRQTLDSAIGDMMRGAMQNAVPKPSQPLRDLPSEGGAFVRDLLGGWRKMIPKAGQSKPAAPMTEHDYAMFDKRGRWALNHRAREEQSTATYRKAFEDPTNQALRKRWSEMVNRKDPGSGKALADYREGLRSTRAGLVRALDGKPAVAAYAPPDLSKLAMKIQIDARYNISSEKAVNDAMLDARRQLQGAMSIAANETKMAAGRLESMSLIGAV